MPQSAQDKRRAIEAKKFRVGAIVRNDNGKFGEIVKINHDNPDGSRFFNVVFGFGKTSMRSDHQVMVVPKSKVSKGALKAIKDVKREHLERMK